MIDVTGYTGTLTADAFLLANRRRKGLFLQLVLRRLDRGAEADRIGDDRKLHRVDPGAFDAHMAEAQHTAPEALVDAHAFDVVERELLGVQ